MEGKGIQLNNLIYMYNFTRTEPSLFQHVRAFMVNFFFQTGTMATLTLASELANVSVSSHLLKVTPLA